MKVEVNRVEGSQQAATVPQDARLLPVVLEPPSTARAGAALVVAIGADLLSLVFGLLFFLEYVEIVIDVITAVILWMLLGWRWPLLPALIAEAIPGLALFPTWTMVAGFYLWESRRGWNRK